MPNIYLIINNIQLQEALINVTVNYLVRSFVYIINSFMYTP